MTRLTLIVYMTWLYLLRARSFFAAIPLKVTKRWWREKKQHSTFPSLTACPQCNSAASPLTDSACVVACARTADDRGYP